MSFIVFSFDGNFVSGDVYKSQAKHNKKRQKINSCKMYV